VCLWIEVLIQGTHKKQPIIPDETYHIYAIESTAALQMAPSGVEGEIAGKEPAGKR